MALFIAELAFRSDLLDSVKLGILGCLGRFRDRGVARPGVANCAGRAKGAFDAPNRLLNKVPAMRVLM